MNYIVLFSLLSVIVYGAAKPTLTIGDKYASSNTAFRTLDKISTKDIDPGAKIPKPEPDITRQADAVESFLRRQPVLETGSALNLPGASFANNPSAGISPSLEALRALASSNGLAAPNLAAFSSQGLSPVNAPLNPNAFGGTPFSGGNIAGASSFAGSPNQAGGLINVLGSLGKELGSQLGIGRFLKAGGLGSSVGGFGGSAGPTFAGLPSVPGLPIPGLGGGAGRQFDFLGLIGGLTRRAFNGSGVAKVLPPARIQGFANNITDTLIPSLPEVDLSKYMGRWFEGINSPKSSNQRCPVHHYGGLTANGKTATFTALKIYRDGSEFGQVQYSIGYAFRGGRESAMLQMHSSESRDPNPYWVYHIGPTGKDSFGNEQYEYVVVSNWIKYPVMVLVRDPDRFQKEYYVDVLRWLEDHGFITDFSRAFNLIQPADYSNCQYEDSTFAAFG